MRLLAVLTVPRSKRRWLNALLAVGAVSSGAVASLLLSSSHHALAELRGAVALEPIRDPVVAHTSWDGHVVDVVGVARPRALVVLLHSYEHGPGNVEEVSGLVDVAVAHGWRLVVPAGRGERWNAGLCCGTPEGSDGPNIVHQFIDHFTAGLPAGTPVVLVGMSNGGMLALDYDCRGFGDVSAVVAISANLQTSTCPHPTAPFHLVRGADDELVPVEGTSWSAVLHTRLLPDADGLALLAGGLGCGAASAVRVADGARTEWSCPNGESDSLLLDQQGHGWPRFGDGDATRIVERVVAAAIAATTSEVAPNRMPR